MSRAAPQRAQGPRSSPIVREAIGGQVSPTVGELEGLASALDRIARVGYRGAQLGLDVVPGVVLVDVRDATTHRMPQRTAHVVVWGGKAEDVFRAVGVNRPRGVELTVQVERARWWHRIVAELRAWAFAREYRRKIENR